MKKIILLACALLLGLSMIACSSKSAEDAGKAYMKTIYDQDVKAYLQHFPKDVRQAFEDLDESMSDDYIRSLISQTNSSFAQLYGQEWYRQIDVKEASSSDDKATVEILINDVTIQILQMIKEDGKWKVDISPTS